MVTLICLGIATNMGRVENLENEGALKIDP